MTTLTLFWHHGFSGHGGWHPGFFLFGPGIFWLGLLFFVVLLKSSRLAWPAPERRREGQDQGPRPAARPHGSDDETGSGPAWPDLDPEPRPQPRPEQPGRDIEIF